VVDFGEEADLGRRHGVVVREKELELEAAACGASARVGSAASARASASTFIRRLRGPVNGDIKVAQIVLVGRRRDALDPRSDSASEKGSSPQHGQRMPTAP